MYKKQNVIRQCSFYVLFMSRYYPPNAFVLGDVRCKYIPVRLVNLPPDKIFVYTAMYVGLFRPSVTGPLSTFFKLNTGLSFMISCERNNVPYWHESVNAKVQ